MRFLRSTLRDSNTTVSLVDLTTVENAGVIRGLESGPGIKLRVVDADETKHITKQKKVIISFDGAPGVGENNTGANVGGGLPVFRDKTGTTLNFRTLTAGGAVELTTVGNTINISAKNITTLGQLSNDIGFVTASQFTGGGDVTVSVSGTEIRVSANAGGITSITETNLGAGAPIIFSISGTSDIRHRPIVGAGAVQISASPTQITISAAPNPTSLSQLTNDTGFITQTSANAAYAAIGSLSALSQLNNNQGFVSAAQFTGGGIVSVQVSGTGAGLEIKISANGALVTSTALGGGQSIITAVSAGRDIIQRTIVGAGAIQVSGGATEITISAAPNPTSLSQLTNDVGFITDVTTSSFAGGESVVFGASANEITFKTFTGGGVVSVTTLGNTINISANTGGGNTTVEQTALGGGEAVIVSISGTTDIQHRTITVNGAIQLSASPTELVLSAAPNPTLLSELTDDIGFITETSALALIAAISASDVSALSQLTNDAGFVNQVSALGGGETVYIGTSANELQFKTFTGGGSVDVTTSGNTIKISAASGGGIAVQVSGVAEGNPSTLNFVATQSNHNLGRAVTIDGSATSTATINLYVPLQFSVRLNWSGTALDVGNEISELPPGWTYDVLSTTQLRINHNLGRVVRNFFWRGFQISGSFYQFTSPTTGGTLRTLLGSETTSFVLQITSTAVAGTVSNGHAYAEVTF